MENDPGYHGLLNEKNQKIIEDGIEKTNVELPPLLDSIRPGIEGDRPGSSDPITRKPEQRA
jgi:hypothetical protein